MADEPSPEKEQTAESPAPEVLKPQTESAAEAPESSGGPADGGQSGEHKGADDKQPPKPPKKSRRGTYRPSHRATFIGLAVVIAILALNAGVIAFVLKAQSKSKSKSDQGQVTINAGALSKLGVNRSNVGDAGIQLTINPDTRFNGNLEINGDVSIAGQLRLNSKFTASDASFSQLEAGKTSLSELNVNGNGTISTLNLRKDLSVAGSTQLQGAVTVSQLLTVNNSANIAGNLSVGGTLSAGTMHVGRFIVDSSLTIGGHVITSGRTPGVSRGSAVGSNGTVSISGNDASGTVAVNIGTGGGNGILASISFHSRYDRTPHVVITPVNGGVGSFFITRSASGFSIGVANSVSPGGYAFDYIVEE